MRPAAILLPLFYLFTQIGVAAAITISAGHHTFNKAAGIVEIPLTLPETIEITRVEILAQIRNENFDLIQPEFVGLSLDNTFWENGSIDENSPLPSGPYIHWVIDVINGDDNGASLSASEVFARLKVNVGDASLGKYPFDLTDVGFFGELGPLLIFDGSGLPIEIQFEPGCINVVPEPKPWMLGLLAIVTLAGWKVFQQQRSVQRQAV